MTVNQTPWPHIVTDNYYETSLFESMKDEITSYVKSMSTLDRQTFFRSSDPTFKTAFPNTFKCANSVSPYDQLKKFSTHRPFKSLSYYFEINVILDGHDYPIHDENPRKVLSIVNYIAPVHSTGTLIYDADKKYIREVEWKQNRTLIFPGLTGVTWHAYKVEPKKPRITLNTFLTRDDLD